MLGFQEQIETQIQKWGDQKLENYEGVCRVFGPVFLEWKKSESTMQKKPFKNWLRVSGSKLNFLSVT